MIPAIVIALLAGLAAYLLGLHSGRRTAESASVGRQQAELAAAGATARALSAEQQREQALVALHAAQVRNIELQGDKSGLAARLAAAEEQVNKEREVLAKARAELTDTFKALAGEALHASTGQFLKLAAERFMNLQSGAAADLEQRKVAIENLVKPVADTLGKVEKQIGEIEKDRAGSYQNLLAVVGNLQTTQQDLRRETGNLVGALRRPNVRGRWGELQLRRVVELAGMLDQVDFQEQVNVASEDGALRPDLVVRLPGGKSIIVDAKAPLSAYLDSLEMADDESRAKKLAEHAKQIRDHIQKLSAKSYWAEFETPEFVVLFIPGEAFYSAALEQDPTLIEGGIDRKVILATPTTLIALLKTVAYGWRQETLANDAREIAALGRELYDRLATMAGHWNRMGKGLSNAMIAYNEAVGSLESRVLPTARRFRDLKVAAEGKEIDVVSQLETIPRIITAEELNALPAPPERAPE
ncbi:MAG: DNA recombination protein RmuC [Pseudomonadota bacterium]|jgi:DNA recombination protein RmuC